MATSDQQREPSSCRSGLGSPNKGGREVGSLVKRNAASSWLKNKQSVIYSPPPPRLIVSCFCFLCVNRLHCGSYSDHIWRQLRTTDGSCLQKLEVIESIPVFITFQNNVTQVLHWCWLGQKNTNKCFFLLKKKLSEDWNSFFLLACCTSGNVASLLLKPG